MGINQFDPNYISCHLRVAGILDHKYEIIELKPHYMDNDNS